MMALLDKPTTDVDIEELLRRCEFARVHSSDADEIKLIRDEVLPLVMAGCTEIVPRLKMTSGILHHVLSAESLATWKTFDDAIERMSAWAFAVLHERARFSRYARVKMNDIGLRVNIETPSIIAISALALRATRESNVGLACVANSLISTKISQDVPGVVERIGGSAMIHELNMVIDDYVRSVRGENQTGILSLL